MTVTMERPHYVGTRRFDTVPRAARAARHRRRTRPLAVLASGAHLVRAAGDRAAARLSAEWTARMTLRVAVVAILAAAVFTGFLALAVVATPDRPSGPRPTFVTP